ncbi:MAG: HNH endonuclease signature motif containing protein, partial [Jiangellaceae bacterium]
KLIITDGVDVLNVTHLGRGPTAAQRAALLWMNPTCSVDGCHRTRVEWDHREPWAQTRHTRLDELDPLCSFHHDLKTRLGWALALGKGKRAFVPPDDPRHPSYRKLPGEQPRPDAAATGPPTRPAAAAAPPGKAGPPRTTRQAAAAQMTLPDPLTQSGGSGA